VSTDSSTLVVSALTWCACLVVVSALAAVGVMTKTLDNYLEFYMDHGAVLPTLSQRMFQVPQYVYVLFIAGVSVGLLLNLLWSAAPGGKLTVNLLLAIVSTLAALAMWAGLSLPLATVNRLATGG
jgi:hypothetical protein